MNSNLCNTQTVAPFPNLKEVEDGRLSEQSTKHQVHTYVILILNGQIGVWLFGRQISTALWHTVHTGICTWITRHHRCDKSSTLTGDRSLIFGTEQDKHTALKIEERFKGERNWGLANGETNHVNLILTENFQEFSSKLNDMRFPLQLSTTFTFPFHFSENPELWGKRKIFTISRWNLRLGQLTKAPFTRCAIWNSLPDTSCRRQKFEFFERGGNLKIEITICNTFAIWDTGIEYLPMMFYDFYVYFAKDPKINLSYNLYFDVKKKTTYFIFYLSLHVISIGDHLSLAIVCWLDFPVSIKQDEVNDESCFEILNGR